MARVDNIANEITEAVGQTFTGPRMGGRTFCRAQDDRCIARLNDARIAFRQLPEDGGPLVAAWSNEAVECEVGVVVSRPFDLSVLNAVRKVHNYIVDVFSVTGILQSNVRDARARTQHLQHLQRGDVVLVEETCLCVRALHFLQSC